MTTGTPGSTARKNTSQQVGYLRFAINFNDNGIAAGVNKQWLPAGAIITDTSVYVGPAFNAGTTNVITVAPIECTKSMRSPEKPATSTLRCSARTSRAIAMRSAAANIGRLLSLSAMPMTTRSNSFAARRTRSSWPRVKGSNVPG